MPQFLRAANERLKILNNFFVRYVADYRLLKIVQLIGIAS